MNIVSTVWLRLVMELERRRREMSETIICEGCVRYVDNKSCAYFGAEIRAVGCSAFKAIEKPKGVCKDCSSWNRRTSTAGDCSNTVLSGCSCSGEDFSCNYFEKRPEPAKPKLKDIPIVGFRYADGSIRPTPTRPVGDRCLRAIAVVVEE